MRLEYIQYSEVRHQLHSILMCTHDLCSSEEKPRKQQQHMIETASIKESGTLRVVRDDQVDYIIMGKVTS